MHVFFLRCFNILCYASGFFMLFLRHVFMMRVRACVRACERASERARVCMCVCVCVRVCVCCYCSLTLFSAIEHV